MESCLVLHLSYYWGAFIFSGLRIDGSFGFAIPRLYDIYHQFLLLYWTYLCVSVCLFCICDILWLTSTFPRHRLDWYSLQHFSCRLPSSWSMFTSPHLQDENLYWRPESIMPTQQATHLAISSSSLMWPDHYFRAGKAITPLHKNSNLAMQD